MGGDPAADSSPQGMVIMLQYKHIARARELQLILAPVAIISGKTLCQRGVLLCAGCLPTPVNVHKQARRERYILHGGFRYLQL